MPVPFPLQSWDVIAKLFIRGWNKIAKRETENDREQNFPKCFKVLSEIVDSVYNRGCLNAPAVLPTRVLRAYRDIHGWRLSLVLSSKTYFY